MSLPAGPLRHRVTFQSLKVTINTFGEQVTAWQDFRTVWAQISPLSAREYMQSQQLQSKVTARIKIRYMDGLTAEMRIKHKSTVYNIDGLIPDPESMREWITIPVSTGANDG